MPLVYDNTRSKKQGGGWIERPDVQAWITQERPQLAAEQAQRVQDSKNRWNTVGKVATAAAAVPFAMAAAPAIFGGSAAAGYAGTAVPGAVPGSILGTGTVGGAGGGMFSLGSFLKSPAMNSLIQGGFGVLGNRSANRQADKANAIQLQTLAQQMGLDRETRAEQMRQFNVQQEQAKAAQAAQNAMLKQQFDADQEERAFQRKLVEDREARLAPYRAAAERNRMSLAAFLGIR